MTLTEETMSLYYEYVMPTYARASLVMVRGKGIKAYDIEGREFLDFFPGWAVSGLGHCHPMVVAAIREQAKKIIHVSNNYYNELQGLLAKKIVETSFDGKVFFCNSGAEAVEGAIKLARKVGHPSRYEIITMENSFHGRTLAAVAATGQPKYQEGFAPLPSGFVHAPFNDLEAVKSKVTDKTIAIMVEPIQGEGGINVASEEFMNGLRQLCDKKGLLLIFDEIQTGMGRTGKMFAIEHFGVVPDIITVAKGIASGMPLGATIALRDIMKWPPGSHGSTFGGNPVSCAAALATIDLLRNGLVRNAERMGKYLMKHLAAIQAESRHIGRLTGKGLMIGMEIVKSVESMRPAPKMRDRIIQACFRSGLLILPCGSTSLRFVPPLVIGRKEADTALRIFRECVHQVEKGHTQ